VTVFQPGDRGLAGAHPGREFGLGEACAQASPEQFGGNLELRRQRVILGLDPGVGEQAGFQLFELDGHVISSARRNASLRRGLLGGLSLSAQMLHFSTIDIDMYLPPASLHQRLLLGGRRMMALFEDWCQCERADTGGKHLLKYGEGRGSQENRSGFSGRSAVAL
jgi:hypothetical protein